MREADYSKLIPSFAPKRFVVDDANSETAVDFIKVFTLFQGKHYRGQFDRQVAVLGKLCQHYQDGIYSSHLPNLLELVDIVYISLKEAKDENKKELLQAFSKLVKLFELPEINNTTADSRGASQTASATDIVRKMAMLLELNDLQLSRNAISVLNRYIQMDDPADLQKLISSKIKLLSSKPNMETHTAITAVPKNPPYKDPIDLNSLPMAANSNPLPATGILYFADLEVVPQILQNVRVIVHSDELDVELVKSMLQLISHLNLNVKHAQSFICNDGIELLSSLLCCTESFSAVDQIKMLSIFWAFLQHPSKIKDSAIESLTSGPCFSRIVAALERLALTDEKSLSADTKELRNELASFVLVILQNVDLNILVTAANDKGSETADASNRLLQCYRTLCNIFVQWFLIAELGTCNKTSRVASSAFSRAAKQPLLPPIGQNGETASAPKDSQLLYRVPDEQASTAEFRKLILDIFLYTLDDSECCELALLNNFLSLVGFYMNSRVDFARERFNIRHIKEIQVRLVSIVSIHLNKFFDEYEAMGGLDWAVQFLRDAVNDENGLTHLSDIHGKLLQLTPIALRHVSLLLNKVPHRRIEIGQKNIFPLLVSLMQCSSTPVESLRLTMYLLSGLCSRCEENQLLFGATSGGPSSLTKFLHFESCSAQEEHAIHMATVEALWGTICGSRANEKAFLASSGVFLLLDNLEHTPSSERGLSQHYLGILLDLLENPLVRAHLLEWRSSKDNRRNVAHLLLKMWREEEDLLQVRYDEHHFINDSSIKPLVGDRQADIAFLDESTCAQTQNEGMSAQDVRYGIRSKVFAVFNQLGFSTFVDALSTSDNMLLIMISNYMDLKIGESWLEVTQELEDEQIRPVTPDRQCLELAKTVTTEKIRVIRSRQERLYEQQLQADQERIDNFYKARKATAIVNSNHNQTSRKKEVKV